MSKLGEIDKLAKIITDSQENDVFMLAQIILDAGYCEKKQMIKKLAGWLDEIVEEAVKQARKEFAEKLKNKIIEDTAYACDSAQHSGYYDYTIKISEIPEYIDEVSKEICGNDDSED